MPNKYLDSVQLGRLITKIKSLVSTTVAGYLPLTGGSITGNLSVSGTITGDVTGDVTGTASGNLPLSGGTMTGRIWFDSSEGDISLTASQNEAGRLRLMGGSGYNKGAQLLLNGQSIASNPGHFQLSATDTTNTVSLYGFPDGRLRWNSQSVIVGTEASESHTISAINSGAQTSFTVSNTPRYYSVSMSGTGFASMLVTKGNGNTFYVINTGSQNRTNITVTVKYIY